jgi:hypothetical protein
MCLIPVVCSVWLPLFSWSWFDVIGGLSEFQNVDCVPACRLFDLSLISQDCRVAPVLCPLQLEIHLG